MFIHRHDFKLHERSNVIQLDDMGYPLRLCILVCKCGMSRQEWLDTSRVEDDVELKWSKIDDQEEILEAIDECGSSCETG